MALTIDGTSSSAGTWTNVSSFSWTHTIGAALNKGGLFVGGQIRDTNAVNNGSITSITWNNGTSQTLVKDILLQNSADGLWSGIFHLVNPNAGFGTITVNLSGASVLETGGAISFSGVDQSNPTNGTAGGTAASIGGGTATITTTIDGCYLLSSIYEKSGNASTDGAGQTRIFELYPGASPAGSPNNTGDTGDMSYKAQTSAGAGTMSYTWSPNDDMDITSVAVRPSVAGTNLIQSSGTAAIGLGSTSANWSLNTTTGNLIVVGVALTNAAILGTVTSVTDSQSNIYTKAASGTLSSVGDILNAELWYAQNIIGGGGSVTVNHTIDNCSMYVREYSGFNTLDIAGSASGSSTLPNSGTQTTNQNTELIIIATGDDKGTSQTWNPAGVFGDMVGTATTLTGISMEDKIVTSTGAQTGTLTLGAAANWDSLIAGFYLVSSGATSIGYKTLLGVGQL